MLSKKPRLTMAMPVYNGANFIADAIESILAQTFDDLELVITDNASTDNTRDIVERYAKTDARIRYVRNTKNIGAAPNYNKGFELARGEYFKWCAHDDVISANFAELCIDVLDRDPGVSVVHGKSVGIDEKGNFAKLNGTETPSITHDDPGERYTALLQNTPDCFPIFGIMRSSMLQRSGLQKLYYGTDRGLLAEMAILGKMPIVEDAIFYNREHVTRSVNLSTNRERAVWHNGSAKGAGSAEFINLTSHLFEISSRHPDIVSPWDIRRRTIGLVAKPRVIGRYAVEITDITMPKVADYLRNLKSGSNSVFGR